MGIKTVAVYSDADKNAPHVVYADEAVHIGPGPASKSYLVQEKIIEAAKKTGADAIHPGYGFLSENAGFAAACEENDITFIGPSASAIKIMGSKLAAKDAVKNYDIPMVPGTDHAIVNPSRAVTIAREIGFPILIKAAAGGGGKGMRIVHDEEMLEEQINRASSEAKSAFGDGSVFIEKYITSPRHIEIQVLADQHQNVIHLFERECSIQRRHQKVVEEAPSSIVSPSLRKRMGEAAINVARACDYVGAGTVEFLVDENGHFYFLEMNTRLQVEHPVTELITGHDLVEQQIRIARGEHLIINQDDLSINGHALELRIYAEDPKDNFLPSIGKLTRYELPAGPGIRVDNGYREGMTIPIFYDPMLAKLIVHASSRMEAIELMKKALDTYHVEGIATTIDFGKFVMNHPAFTSGKFDTHFVDQYFKPGAIQDWTTEEKVAARMALKAYLEQKSQLQLPAQQDSPWKSRTR